MKKLYAFEVVKNSFQYILMHMSNIALKDNLLTKLCDFMLKILCILRFHASHTFKMAALTGFYDNFI